MYGILNFGGLRHDRLGWANGDVKADHLVVKRLTKSVLAKAIAGI